MLPAFRRHKKMPGRLIMPLLISFRALSLPDLAYLCCALRLVCFVFTFNQQHQYSFPCQWLSCWNQWPPSRCRIPLGVLCLVLLNGSRETTRTKTLGGALSCPRLFMRCKSPLPPALQSLPPKRTPITTGNQPGIWGRGTSIWLSIFLFNFPLLILKGIYHYWKYLYFSRGLEQMEGKESHEPRSEGTRLRVRAPRLERREPGSLTAVKSKT